MKSLSPRWLMAGVTVLALSNLALSPAQTRSNQTEFEAVAGQKEFTGQMIARPMPAKWLAAEGLSQAEIESARAEAVSEMANYSVIEHVSQTDEYVFYVPAGMNENEVARALIETGNFQYAEPNWMLYPLACPNDPGLGNQWHHDANRMQSCDAWGLHTGTPSVAVGICDTGIRTTHEDFQLHRLEGYNAVDRLWENSGGNIGAVHPHGTMTTGCAAANGNNNKGVSGVGWDLSHRMLRVSNSSGGGAFLDDLNHAARTSVENGDRVASVSYSGVDTSANLTTATYIKSIGGLMVWAAGNDGRTLTFGNRDNDDLIVAGATTPGDGLASFSARGPFVDLTAPGESVYTTDAGSNTDYEFVSGTSFACPLTAGLIALIWSTNPALTPDQVEDILKQGCDDKGVAGVDNTFGYGRINSFNSVTAAGGGGVFPPIANFSGTPVSGDAPLTVNFSDLSTGGPAASWSWSFGDTGSSTSQNPSHTYTSAGSYTVSLTTTGPGGSDTETKVNYITADEPVPVADFTGTPLSGNAPLTVNFTDQTMGTVTNWSWSFGDGSPSATTQNPTNIYTQSGTYTVILSVVGPGGFDSEFKASYITVTDPWTDLGSGLAGTSGVPLLTGEGSLAQGSNNVFALTNARANSTTTLVVGLSALNLPFKGGILVPATDWLFFGLPTDASGEFSFSNNVSNSIASGTTVFMQFWVNDPVGPFGFAASNGISQTAP